MQRHPEWHKRLPLVYEKHSALPGQWGVSDCWILTMDALEAVTGEIMFPKLRKYSSEKSGYKLFAKQGFKTVDAALASMFEPVPKTMMQRGDVGTVLFEGVLAAGYMDAEGFVSRTLDGLARIDLDKIHSAYKVAR